MHRTATGCSRMCKTLRYCAIFLPAHACTFRSHTPRICRRVVVASLRKSLRLIRISSPTPRLSPLKSASQAYVNSRLEQRARPCSSFASLYRNVLPRFFPSPSPLSLSISLSLLFFSSVYLSSLSEIWLISISLQPPPFPFIPSLLAHLTPPRFSSLPSPFCLGFCSIVLLHLFVSCCFLLFFLFR